MHKGQRPQPAVGESCTSSIPPAWFSLTPCWHEPFNEPGGGRGCAPVKPQPRPTAAPALLEPGGARTLQPLMLSSLFSSQTPTGTRQVRSRCAHAASSCTPPCFRIRALSHRAEYAHGMLHSRPRIRTSYARRTYERTRTPSLIVHAVSFAHETSIAHGHPGAHDSQALRCTPSTSITRGLVK
jgi:hypothetical protein